MVESYCVRCKQKTQNVDEQHVTTKNNRKALKSTCSICKFKKCQFVKSDTKGGAVEPFPGEHHL